MVIEEEVRAAAGEKADLEGGLFMEGLGAGYRDRGIGIYRGCSAGGPDSGRETGESRLGLGWLG